MPGLRPRGDCLQLLPEPALSQVPGSSASGLARGAAGQTARRAVFPRGLHAARSARPAGVAEPASALRSVVPCCFGDASGDCPRRAAPRRPDRLYGRVTYLGTDPAASSPPALRRPGRGAFPGRAALGCGPRIPARTCAQPPVPGQVPRLSAAGLRGGSLCADRPAPGSGPAKGLARVPRTGCEDRMGGLCEASVRLTGA